MRSLAFVGALLALAVWASAAHACSCIPVNAARMLADSDAALVGVVETKTDDGTSYVIRVEKALKGDLGERITLPSPLTSCQVNYSVGQRVAVVLSGAREDWSLGTCNSVDADALLAASELPVPTGAAARFLAAVDGKDVDAVALGSDGKPAGYGWREGRPLALATCGPTSVVAVSSGGKVKVITRVVPDLIPTGSTSTLALKQVAAVECTPDGRTFWIAGVEGDRTVVRAVRRGQSSRRLLSAPAGAAVSIVDSRAYVASRGRVDVVTLATGRVRTVRHSGEFTQLSVHSGRVVGRLRGGRAGVLDLGSGALRTGTSDGPLTWISRDRVLDATGGTIRDGRLRVVRHVSGTKGRVVATEAGAAYLADGEVLRRLAPGASRSTVFARLPGKVVALTLTATQAAAAWHSCEKSAKTP